MIVNILFQDYE
uniref:Uncharacterized protein n=1 Tax=Rhizophora mucronata TaxID=61149 RepID=A0A2P2NDZ4_RHIMU